ncbi:hypothetical protein GJ496_001820 [Pomphorhynchus laevis]|nr:hypothetical protein GJ496_001820 [Pomphorhynchus laevis]
MQAMSFEWIYLQRMCNVDSGHYEGLRDFIQSVMEKKLKQLLKRISVPMSFANPYHLKGNGQCERYNGILWKSIEMDLRTKQLPIVYWEKAFKEHYKLHMPYCVQLQA